MGRGDDGETGFAGTFELQRHQAADISRHRLVIADFEQWKPLRLAYMLEEGLTQDLTNEQLQKTYVGLVERKSIWGLFDEGGIPLPSTPR